MALRAPTVRQHRSADALLGLLRPGFAAIAAHRPGQPAMALPDARMAACALCSLQAPPLWACDRERTEGNLPRVSGIARVPCDAARRDLLEPVAPEARRPFFPHVLRALQRGTGLAERVVVEGHSL